MHMSYGMFGRLAGVVACMAMLVSASGCMPDASAPANRPTSGDETDMAEARCSAMIPTSWDGCLTGEPSRRSAHHLFQKQKESI